MFYIIRDIVFILLLIIGLIDVVKTIILFFLNSKQDKNTIIIVPLTKNDENIEQILRSTATKVKFIGKNTWQNIVCIDYGINEENKKICEKMCNDFPFMKIIKKEKALLLFNEKNCNT